MQLEPYLRVYGPESILPMLFDRVVDQPDVELERLGRFLGVHKPLCWDHTLKPQNVGRERLRNSPLREAIVRAPVLSTLRRTLIPRLLTDNLKSLWKVGIDPPSVPASLHDRLRKLFDRDLARLGSWLGIELDCDTFHEFGGIRPLSWAQLDPDLCCSRRP